MEKKTLEMLMIGGGIGLQATTYYLKYYRPYSCLRKGKKKAAAISHALGYPPSITAKILLGMGGYMYIKDSCKAYSGLTGLAECLIDQICK